MNTEPRKKSTPAEHEPRRPRGWPKGKPRSAEDKARRKAAARRMRDEAAGLRLFAQQYAAMADDEKERLAALLGFTVAEVERTLAMPVNTTPIFYRTHEHEPRG